MLSLLELLLAVFSIYSALSFSEETKLLVPLACLFLMLLVSRIDRDRNAKKAEQDREKEMGKEPALIKDQDFFTIESLLWPKNELLLTDAVHTIFKNLGFKISTGVNYHSVDRIIKIPNTEESFGVEILMSEKEAEESHPKLRRALEFEKEKKGKEKTLIIASTHIHLPLSERDKVKDVSKRMVDFLTQHNMSFITTYEVYELWQRARGGGNNIFGIFQELYAHSGGAFHLVDNKNLPPLSPESPIQ
ncbi:MAG: hypothetical protein ACE144_00795 [Thermodesulfobacteriota bacterium]